MDWLQALDENASALTKTKLEILVSNLGPKRTTSTTAIGPRLLDTSLTETALGEMFQI